MDLEHIKEQLNAEFSKSSVKYVFWFDDKAEYESEIGDITLENAKTHVLDGRNWLYSKWLLFESDPDSKYLIYAPFSRPSDAENPLADAYYYSVPYYTDRVSQMSQEIGMETKFKEHLEGYSNFWKNKNRIEKFKELGIDHYTPETIDIGLLAVLVGVKTPSFEEVVKQLLLAADVVEYFKAFEANGLEDCFWKLCEKYFGYKSEKKSIDDLAACLIMTYTHNSMKGTLPDTWNGYVLDRKNDAVVFVRNIMDNILYKDRYDEISAKIDKNLRVTAKIEEEYVKGNIDLADITECDSFSGIDDIIIQWALERLGEELIDSRVGDMTIEEIADLRMGKAYHYSDKYANQYKALKYAYKIMKSISLMEFSSDIEKMITNYRSEKYLVDSYYRWFYYAYDQIDDNDAFSMVQERVENIYSNTWLQKMVPRWNESLTQDVMDNLDITRQEKFFDRFLQPYDGKERVIVIISDALRYECAMELINRFEFDEKCTAKMDVMLSGLPSVTSVGMASLLPHKELLVDEKLNISIDGSACGDLQARDKILKAKNEKNAAIAFDDIYKAGKARTRELLQGKNIVYIYHNQIDARGDKPASEDEVFNACAEALNEIVKLVRRLTGDVSATRFIITADHGFLYKRNKLQESDKVPVDRSICTYDNKRFLITTKESNQQGTISRIMAYMNHFVTTPIGADIFAVGGGGSNYVHGGSSMQEMLIPVVEVKTATGKQDYDFADVILISVSRKVTNLITFFDFIQTEKVTDVMKARNLIAFFATEEGEKISFDVPLVANIKDDAPDKRTFHEKFTLKSREYKREDKYYMHIADAEDEKNILHSYEFMIDIALAEDFGF
ncbi:BREX-1 system phosphatase PglZ type A [Butyrivibrio sp. FCS006]|uniref:BREX-1 system phosphatase PglZ type A n=1 Tax=Butyrivibrio sp. FCS006 TaxID=1280684 RepID=UPI00040F4342|nr:BREX-1 system phosphatase PglZ type A [Butyrivibrio sp. FCS006]